MPATRAGIALAIADKLDTLAGIFAIGQKPTGTRDPFGLRRAALGVLRTILERQLELDLRELIEAAVARAARGKSAGNWPTRSVDYMMERLRASYLEARRPRVTTEMFDAVLDEPPHSPLDFDERLRALERFLELPEAASLAAANKRIANILRKAPGELPERSIPSRLQEAAERQLFEHVVSMERAVNPLFARREYAQALTQLASLRDAVDRFFDKVHGDGGRCRRAREPAGPAAAPARPVPAVRRSVAAARLSGGLRCSCCGRCSSRRACFSAVAVRRRSRAPGLAAVSQALRRRAQLGARAPVAAEDALRTRLHRRRTREHPAGRARLDVEALLRVGNDRAGRVFPPQAWVLKREMMWIPFVGWAVRC